MDDYEVLRQAAGSREPAVLATVIGVEGHAYRKAGAMMLLLEGGGRVGGISPGCLETDLRERMPFVLEGGDCEIVHYNMRPEEDVVWGETVGCGGEQRILLEPVDGGLREVLREALQRLDAGEAATLVRWRAGAKLRYALGDERGVHSAGCRAGDAGSAREEPLFALKLEPRPRLVLFGAGQDADPVFAIVGRIGFRLAIADWRPELLAPERFPGAELASGSAAEIAARLRLHASDYVIVCGHQLRRDREMLETLLPLVPAYLGVVGSSSRIRLLFEGLPRPAFVRAPVGLAIGADGADEIAVSIAAELIAVRSRLRKRKEVGGDGAQAYGHLFGGGAEPADGAAQAGSRADAR